MATKAKEYSFKTNLNLNSVHEVFWITHDFFIKCPNTILNISKSEDNYSILSIMNSNLSLYQIQTIFKENQIQYYILK